MNSQPTIQLPLSSSDESFGLLEEFISENSENGNIEELEFQFDLLSKGGKYLGEDLYVLNTGGVDQNTVALENEIVAGQQIVDIFRDNNGSNSFSLPLSSSTLSDVATAGSNFLESDIIWQFDGNNLEGAWLKSFDNEQIETQACIKLNTGQTEFRFPYIDKGLIHPDGSWDGMGINNCNISPYVDTQNLSSGEPLYWEQPTELSSSSSINLQESSLISSGAKSSKNVFKADQIVVKPDRDSPIEEFAWVYDFSNTELPIGCGETTMYWPLSISKEDGQPIPIAPEQVEDINLKDLWINKTMCGAIAGLTPETSDKIFLQSSECGYPAQGAWLRGSDVEEIGSNTTLSATNEDLFRYSEVYLSEDNIVLSAEVPPPEADNSILNCCGSSYDPERIYSGNVSSEFKNVVGGIDLDFREDENYLEWGSELGGGSKKNKITFTPENFNISLGEGGVIGELTYENSPTIVATNATSFDIEFNIDFEFLQTNVNFPVVVQATGGIGGGDSDSIKFDEEFSDTTFKICDEDFVLKLDLELVETTGGFLDKETLSIYSEENKKTTVKIIAKLVKETEIIQTSFLYNLKSFVLNETDYEYSWSLDKSNGTFLIFAESIQDGIPDEEFEFNISSDGFSYLRISDSETTNEVYSRIFIDRISQTIKDINGSSRQSGLHFIAPKDESGYFFWEFPDININEVFRGVDHDSYCDYLNIENYSSVINPKDGQETSQWEKCNCKAQYYSPFGHNLNFDDYKEYSDIIMEDDGQEIFSFENWVDSEGKGYKNSNNFGIFKYSGPEPDVGFGIGTWETYGGGEFVLKKGKSYRYVRTSLGDCNDHEVPCLVVNSCHCLDKCDDDVDNIKWIKLTQNTNGEWEDTGEVTDMVFRSGQFYQYQRQDKFNYNIVKDGRIITRETNTPSFALNVSFNSSIPYWAKSARLGGLNYGTDTIETDKYLLTTQPEPSDIVLNNNTYVKYIRNDCNALKWNQPLTFSVDFKTNPTWKKLEFGFVSPPLLQKIIGCSTCGIEYDSSRDSCFLMDENCKTHIASFTETDIDSDMILRSSLNCENDNQIFFEAKNSFTWTDDFNVGENFVGDPNSVEVYMEAPTPWRNLLNENTSTVHFDERGLQQKTSREVGLFKPKLVGTNKTECFDIKKSV